METAELIQEENHTHTITVPSLIQSERIDGFLAHEFSDYSRSFFQRLVKKGLIKVNGTTIARPSFTVKASDLVHIEFPQKPSFDQELLNRKTLGVELVYEHEHFLIIHKPAGLMVHRPTTESTAITLVEWLMMTCKDIAQVGAVDRPGIVHRLDKDTSGLLIIPRTNYAFTHFGDMFKNRTIEKTYLAVVKGHTCKTGTIDLPIGRHPIERHKMATFTHTDLLRSGKTIRHATTHFITQEYFSDSALIQVKPVTGRTHQIRVHCAALGHPLLGDPVYGTVSKHIDRHALHAYAIAFTFEGKDFTFTKEPPSDFTQLVQTLRLITDPTTNALLTSA